MASFRTEFSTRLHKTRIGIASKMLTIGSCFSDSIGSRLQENKITTLPNPFGVAYNPVSIQKLLRLSIGMEDLLQETFLERDGIFFNDDFHSSLSGSSEENLRKVINHKLNEVKTFLSTCDFLIITWGTAWVYERKNTNRIVSNCHKQASTQFTKRLLTQEEILTSFNELQRELFKFNPRLKIILTLSPVRHLKDTMELNTVSKSILRSAIYSITQTHEDIDYFPAFEIMMDDLRDYRFYASDMIHPSKDAEAYIWEKFADRYFDTDTKEIIQQWESIQKLLAHKPFHATSASHQKFLRETLLKLKSLQTKINVEEEILRIEQSI